jgi:hypothetical protein
MLPQLILNINASANKHIEGKRKIALSEKVVWEK